MLVLLAFALASDGCEVEVRKRVQPIFPPSDLQGEVVCRVHVDLDARAVVTGVRGTDCSEGLLPAVSAALRRWDIRMSDGCGTAATGRLDMWFGHQPVAPTEDDVFTDASLTQVGSAFSPLPPQEGCRVSATVHSSGELSSLGQSARDCVGLPDWTPVWPGYAADGLSCDVTFRVKGHRAKRFDASSCPQHLQSVAVRTAEGWAWYNPFSDAVPYTLHLAWTTAPVAAEASEPAP